MIVQVNKLTPVPGRRGVYLRQGFTAKLVQLVSDSDEEGSVRLASAQVGLRVARGQLRVGSLFHLGDRTAPVYRVSESAGVPPYFTQDEIVADRQSGPPLTIRDPGPPLLVSWGAAGEDPVLADWGSGLADFSDG